MIFDDFALFQGVTVGWVAVSVMVFAILINSILNIPKGIVLHGRHNDSRN